MEKMHKLKVQKYVDKNVPIDVPTPEERIDLLEARIMSLTETCGSLTNQLRQTELALLDIIERSMPHILFDALLKHYKAQGEHKHGYACPGENGDFDNCNCGFKRARLLLISQSSLFDDELIEK